LIKYEVKYFFKNSNIGPRALFLRPLAAGRKGALPLGNVTLRAEGAGDNFKLMHNIQGVNSPSGEATIQQVNRMKVSVPVMGDKGLDEIVGGHFGKSPGYVIYDTESKTAVTIKNTSEHLGGVGFPPELLAKNGVNVVACSNLGPKAVDMLASLNIEVYVGARGTVRDALEAWQRGELEAASLNNACQEHGHH
jgi:predicted Fe-Mo cluster-binding NifX family protein